MTMLSALRATTVLALTLCGGIAATADEERVQIYAAPIQARIIEQFRIGSEQQLFGPLAFVGGLEMVSSQSHFGALSALILDEAQTGIVAVADTGFWFKGELVRDPETRRLVGVENALMAEMARSDGKPLRDKWLADAEGLAKTPTGVAVSFEREHRIETHAPNAESGFYILQDIVLPPVDPNELRHNRGFEGIAIAPESTAWPGALVGISEKSLDDNGNFMGFVAPVNGPSFEFSLARSEGFDVTDIGFLPDGGLLVLERRFTIQSGVAMRIRHVAPGALQTGKTVDAAIWVEADMRHQIDNMEGLDVSIDPDGTPRITLVSDDNHSILQRNLLLEFRLVGASGIQRQ